jgi:hypothetical protein
VQVPAGQLEADVERVDPWPRHRPHGRLSCALPPDQPVPVGEAYARLLGCTPSACPTSPYVRRDSPRSAGSRVAMSSARRLPLTSSGYLPSVNCKVARGDDEDVVSRPPDLDEGWVLPCRWPCSLHASVNRQKRGPGHAVLQARPRHPPQRRPSPREPLVKGADAPAVRQDLRPREVEPRPAQDNSAGEKLSSCL